MTLEDSQEPAAPPAILVQGLGKRFGRFWAIRDVGFTIPAGSITALLGGNGAGKTTTLSILLGLLLPTVGRVEVLGTNMLADRYRVLGRMNVSSPYVDLPQRLTVRENLSVYARLYGVASPRARIAELAGDLDLEAFIDRPTGRLSAGQKTRVSLAKALINRPELLLLDEPTASLDPDTADWLRSYFLRYAAARGATLLMASHNMAEVELMADSVLMMKGGGIVDRGSPSQLIARHGRRTLEEVFLHIARSDFGADAAVAEHRP